MKKIFLSFMIIILFFGCNQKVKSSTENLELIFSSRVFEIIELEYGGLGGVFENRFIFREHKKQIEVETKYGINESRKVMISRDDFKEIKNVFNCVVLNQSENDSPSSNCIFPSKSEFFIKNNFKKLRLYDPQNRCNVSEIFKDKLNFPNLLDLINGF